MTKYDKERLEMEIKYMEERLEKLKRMRSLPKGTVIIGVGSSGEGVTGYRLPNGKEVHV